MSPAERVLGIDLSLNHAGFVELDPKGRVVWMHHVTITPGVVKKTPKHCTLLPKTDATGDKSAHMVARLSWWEGFLAKVMVERMPTHVGIEDYAISPAQSNNVYQIGEQGGLARLASLEVGAALRLHDPMTVKMFGALSGNATPHDLADAVKERFGVDFGVLNLPAKAGKNVNRDPECDMCSAYVVARLVWTEVQLRAGRMKLTDLHEQEVRVFNRVTKTYPVNILARDWIKRPTAA